MIHGGKKFEKTQKSKFKEKSEKETFWGFRFLNLKELLLN
jgi:hypothetical protein